MKENVTQKLSNSMFLNVIISSFSGVARFFQFRVELFSMHHRRHRRHARYLGGTSAAVAAGTTDATVSSIE